MTVRPSRSKALPWKDMLSRRSVVSFPIAALLTAGDGEASLFDGSTSTGWLSISGDPFPQRSWATDNGCLKAKTPKPGVLNRFGGVRRREGAERQKSIYCKVWIKQY